MIRRKVHGARYTVHHTPLILYLFLCSCSSIYQLSIEVQEPASVTLPAGIGRMVVVNNAVAQPNEVGVHRTYQGQAVHGMELDLDSTAWVTASSLASTMEQTHFFDYISLCLQSSRTDDEWMTGYPLSETFKQEIFETQGFDGAVTIDRILFNLQEDVKGNAAGYISHGNIILSSVLTCSVYLHNKEKALTTFTVTDSLSYQPTLYLDTTSIFKELPEYLIDNLAYNIGEKLAWYLAPSWKVQDRVLYSEQQARMKEALGYVKTGKWGKAETVWMNEYARTSKPMDKGRLANNIAVAGEMQDKFEEALRWAKIARENLREGHLQASSDEWLQISAYIGDLEKRIQNNPLLDLQWGAGK